MRNRTFSSRTFIGLPYDVDYSLARLLERELDFVRSMSNIVRDVNLRYDFNINDIFRTLDCYNFNYITIEG